MKIKQENKKIMEKLKFENLKINELTKKSLNTIYGGNGEIVFNDAANTKLARLKSK